MRPSTRAAALATAPVLLVQGRLTKRRIPRLPEAAGSRSGLVGAHTAHDAPPLSVLVIGESTAVGVGAPTQDAALAGHLARALAHDAARPVAWTALGRSGASARHVLRDLVPQVDGTYDVAVVVLGVNDTLALTSLRAWRATVGAVIDGLKPHVTATGTVVLAGLPAVGRFVALPRPTRTVLGRHATALDDELAALAADRTARDTTAAAADSHAPRVLHVRTPLLGSGPMLAVDRFHPSAMGYELWGAHLARELRDQELRDQELRDREPKDLAREPH